MKAASISELKTALHQLSDKEVIEVCLRLVRSKKENKELLSYLLFESDDEPGFITSVKEEMDDLFRKLPRRSLYNCKTEIRKILKLTNQKIKYSGQKRTEVELLIHFCKQLKESGIALHNHPVLLNLYLRQKQKIRKTLSTLHEDLQFDYSEIIKEL